MLINFLTRAIIDIALFPVLLLGVFIDIAHRYKKNSLKFSTLFSSTFVVASFFPSIFLYCLEGTFSVQFSVKIKFLLIGKVENAFSFSTKFGSQFLIWLYLVFLISVFSCRNFLNGEFLSAARFLTSLSTHLSRFFVMDNFCRNEVVIWFVN